MDRGKIVFTSISSHANYTGQQISKKFLYLWWICY